MLERAFRCILFVAISPIRVPLGVTSQSLQLQPGVQQLFSLVDLFHHRVERALRFAQALIQLLVLLKQLHCEVLCPQSEEKQKYRERPAAPINPSSAARCCTRRCNRLRLRSTGRTAQTLDLFTNCGDQLRQSLLHLLLQLVEIGFVLSRKSRISVPSESSRSTD